MNENERNRTFKKTESLTMNCVFERERDVFEQMLSYLPSVYNLWRYHIEYPLSTNIFSEKKTIFFES